jgi:hypothetical protein
VINVTDPDSRNVKTSRGWVQGYNAQAVVTAQQIVIAAEVTVDSPDFGHFEPMITAAHAELAAGGIETSPEVVLADAGYWHQLQIDTIVGRGMQVLIPPDAGTRASTRPGWDGGRYAFMRRRAVGVPAGASCRGVPPGVGGQGHRLLTRSRSSTGSRPRPTGSSSRRTT